MKQQLSIQELAQQLDHRAASKKDYIANSAAIHMASDPGDLSPVLSGLNGDDYPLTEHAHSQLATALAIPKKYYDKMREESPHLLEESVNTWLGKEPQKKRMIRTLDNKVRAVLSSSYRPLDNFDLAKTVLPILNENSCSVESSALTETRMYIKATMPKLSGTIGQNDVVQAGIVISNSEVGAGAVKVEPMIYRLVCLNGMISADRSMRKYHVGKGVEADFDMSILTTEARQADDKAFWLKVRDIVKGAFNEDLFIALTNRMRGTKDNAIVNPDVVEVISNFKEAFRIGDGTGNQIMQHLISGGDLTQFGLLNATTRASQDVEDYDDATELERIGGKVLELSQKDWKEIAA